MTRSKPLIALVLSVFAACVDSEHGLVERPDRTFDETATQATLELELETPCDEIVETEGPCAVACDPLALAEHIQPGTCSTFLCHRADETVVLAGGCRF